MMRRCRRPRTRCQRISNLGAPGRPGGDSGGPGWREAVAPRLGGPVTAFQNARRCNQTGALGTLATVPANQELGCPWRSEGDPRWGQWRLSKSTPRKVEGLVLAVVRYCRRCQQPPCRRVAPCSPPARRPPVALRGEGAHPLHALCSLGTLFSRSLWPLCLRRPVVSIAPRTLRAFWSGVGRLVKRGGD